MVTESFSARETYELGRKLGEEATPGCIYALFGDLGVGKTVFTKGFAEGLGIKEHVSSPTFTIVQVYEEGRLPFYHFDVYRISDLDEMDEIEDLTEIEPLSLSDMDFDDETDSEEPAEDEEE